MLRLHNIELNSVKNGAMELNPVESGP